MLLVSRIEIVIVTVLALSTLVLYVIAARRWYETPYGRVMFTVLACFAVTMSLACVTIYFSLQSPWIPTLRAATYFFAIVAYVHIFVSIFRMQRNPKRGKGNEDARSKDA